MPKTETQTIKVQDVRKDDVVTWHDVKYAVTGRTTKTKFVYVDTTTPGTALRIEHGTDVQVERQVPTAAEKYDDARTLVVDSIQHEIRGARKRRDAARAKVLEYFEKDYVLGWSVLSEMAEADAKWNIMARFVREDEAEVSDDMLIAQARHVVEQERDALLGDRYRGQSTNPMSNALEAAQRHVASELVGNFYGLATLLRHLDGAAAARDAEAERIADGHLNG